MKILIVYAHPNPKSFNHAVLEATQESLKASGHEIKTKDLYQMKFKASLDAEDLGMMYVEKKMPPDILQEQADVSWAEAMIFIYPLWWFDRPAILKGWFDRVFTYGFAFGSGPKGIQGLLKHKKALVLNTTGAPKVWYEEAGHTRTYLSPTVDGTLKWCGIPVVEDYTFFGVTSNSQEDRQNMLGELKALLQKF